MFSARTSVAFYANHGEDMDTLISRAERAMDDATNRLVNNRLQTRNTY
jgi:hypothetical protein